MRVPENYNGPVLDIVLRTLKPVDNTDEVISKVLSTLPQGAKVCLYQKD
jgi:nucleosome binding factor SPN SPT16 subunit